MQARVRSTRRTARARAVACDDVDGVSSIRVRDCDQVCGRGDDLAPAGDEFIGGDEHGRVVGRRSWVKVLGVGSRGVTSLVCGSRAR